jgi:CPA2 family monovalent cation:H+ antiporter-2
MLFDPRIVVEQPILVFGLLFGFLAVKGLLATLAALAMRFPARVAWLAGVGLAQFGEFGFVLTQIAESHSLIEPEAVRPLLAAGVMSMFVTPLLVRAAPHITAGEKLLAPLERLIGVRGIDQIGERQKRLHGHVLIVGFGVAGRLLAEALRLSHTPFVALEMNAENVRSGRRAKIPVYYGDATSEEALEHAQLRGARLVVLLINDEQAADRVVDTIRRVAPDVPVLARTRYLADRPRLIGLGARDVVAEEAEGAMEVISRVLRLVETPRNAIEDAIRQARSSTQTSHRKVTVPRLRFDEVAALSDLKIETAQVRDGSPLVGQSPVTLRLRSTTGALAVGVRRNDRLLENPDPHVAFEVGDVVYLVGTGEALRSAIQMFDKGDMQSEAVSQDFRVGSGDET